MKEVCEGRRGAGWRGASTSLDDVSGEEAVNFRVDKIYSTLSGGGLKNCNKERWGRKRGSVYWRTKVKGIKWLTWVRRKTCPEVSGELRTCPTERSSCSLWELYRGNTVPPGKDLSSRRTLFFVLNAEICVCFRLLYII